MRFRAVWSVLSRDLGVYRQCAIKPDYEETNNTSLGMFLNATTGSLPAGPPTSVLRWSGPDPVTIQVQCTLYTTLPATLLASFLAMLGKQWLNRYWQSGTHGSAADRSRVRERRLYGIETWKFYLVIKFLSLILQYSVRIGPFGIRTLSVPVGGQPFGLLGRDWIRVFRAPLLPAHHHGVQILLLLPVPNPVLAPDSVYNRLGRPVLTKPSTMLWTNATTPTTGGARDATAFANFSERCRH